MGRWATGLKKMAVAALREAVVLRLPRVMSRSARRWASLALGHVVEIDSCSIREVTRLRRRAMRWEEVRFRWRCLSAPPAMMGRCVWVWVWVLGGGATARAGEEGCGWDGLVYWVDIGEADSSVECR